MAMRAGCRGLLAVLGLALAPALAGCLSDDGAAGGAPEPDGAPTAAPEPRFGLTECQGSLSIWLVPADLLAADLPSEFPPQAYQAATAGTPADLGRVLFHVFSCAANDRDDLEERQSLAILSVRVDPPAAVAPNGTGWQTAYVLGAWSTTPGMAALLARYPTWGAGEDGSTYGSLATAPSISVRWTSNGTEVLAIEQAPVPPPEQFDPRMRFYRIEGDALRIQDFALATTLWEGLGQPRYDEASPLARYIRGSVGAPDLHGLPAVTVDAEFASVPWPLAP